mmetsp:Transcript_29124/g.66315  ORF Transcript_29124/g.66315 Transcript_29124/m.66315 type:complete len:825 (+) Transcript_29124:404-2878(+)
MAKTKRRRRNRRSDGVAGTSAETPPSTPDRGFFFRRWREHTLFRVELSWSTRLHYFLTGCAALVASEYVFGSWFYFFIVKLKAVGNVNRARLCAGLATWGALSFVIIATETGRTGKKYTLIESLMAILIFEMISRLVEVDSYEAMYHVSNFVFAMAGLWYMSLGDDACKRILRKGREEFWEDRNSVAGVQACYNGLAMTTMPMISIYLACFVGPGGNMRTEFCNHKFCNHMSGIALAVVSAYFFARGEWPFTPKPTPKGHDEERHEFTTCNRGENFMEILDTDGTLMLPLEGAGNAITPAVNLCWKENDACIISSDCTSRAHKRLLLVTLLNGLAESTMVVLLAKVVRRGILDPEHNDSFYETPPTRMRLFSFGLQIMGLLHTAIANANFKSLSEKCNESNSYNVRETSKKLRSYYAAFFRGLCLVACQIPSVILSRHLFALDATGAVFCGYSAIRVAVMLCQFAVRKLLPAKSKPGDATEDRDHSNTITGRRGRSKKRKDKGQRDREPLDTPGEKPNHESFLVDGDEGSRNAPELRARTSNVILRCWARIMTMVALPIERHSHSMEASQATESGKTNDSSKRAPRKQGDQQRSSNHCQDTELSTEFTVERKNNESDGAPESSTISRSDDQTTCSATTCSATSIEDNPLLAFLRSQKACIKGSVDDFHEWLIKSEDIDTMESLKEAVQDDVYLDEKMKAGDGVNGIKGYKRGSFRRAVLGHSDKCSQPSNSTEYNTTVEPPSELVCPIGLELMTNDPVVASDGITYERANIEAWFRKHLDKGGAPMSPSYGTPMTNLNLTPNTNVRQIARDWTRSRWYIAHVTG